LSHWDPYAMHRGGCLELYYCNMVEWSWWDSSLIWKTSWLHSVLWHCWFGHMTCKIVPDMTCNVFGGTLNLSLSIYPVISTLSWAVLTVLWIGFCHTGSISLCVDSFVFTCLYSVFFHTAHMSYYCNGGVDLVELLKPNS